VSASEVAKRESLTKGSMFMLGTTVWVTLVGYALNLFLARQFGPELFGFFGVVITIMMWLELALAEGIPIWSVRLMAKDGPPALPRAYVTTQLAIGLVLMVMLIAAATPLATLFGEPDKAHLLMIVAVDIPLFGLYALVLGIMMGKQQYGRRTLAALSYVTGKLVVVVGAVLLGYGITGAVIGNVASTVVGITVGIGLIISLWGIRGITSKRKIGDELGGAVRGSVVPAVAEFLRLFIVTFDLWVVKAVLPAASAGLYRASQLIAIVPFVLASGLGGAFYASFSAAYQRGDIEKCRHYVSQTTRLLITAGALWVAVVPTHAEDLLAFMFSDQYEAGGLVLVILSVGLVVATPVDMVSGILLVAKRYRLLLGSAIALVIIEIVLVFWLVSLYEMTGVALGVASVFIVGGVASMVYLRNYQQTNPLVTVARVLPATLIVGWIFYWVHAEPGLLLAAMYALSPLVFGLLLLPTGGLTRHDLRKLLDGLLRRN